MKSNESGAPSAYDRLKKHEGAGYSGMPVGRAHKWYYDQGEWRGRKLSPDEWEIYYQTTKRRAARAPDESGAPIGTEYNWLIVSHQRVSKLDANSYMTCLEGKKFKVAHKRADKDKWSASEKSQRRQVIRYLEEVIEELKQADEVDTLPYSVGERDRIYGLSLRTKAELYEMGKSMGLPGISKMKREELLEAVKEALDTGARTTSDGKGKEKTQAQAPTSQLQKLTKDDLYRMASERDISGRSDMNKAQLVHALRSTLQQPRSRAY